jgi:uncharacterized BrkB/YihY/UPF0761 family membrane protein
MMRQFILMVVVAILFGLVLSVAGCLLAVQMVNYYPDFKFGGLPGYEGWGLLGQIVGFLLGSVGGACIFLILFNKRG